MAPTPPPVPKKPRIPLPIKWLIGLCVLLLLTAALFYPVENWRGKRAWENCQRALEARGEVLDWEAYIPLPVPDEQNIFKAPRMAEWFVGRGTNELARRLDPENLREFSQRHHTNVIAELTIMSLDDKIAPGNGGVVLRYDPPVLSDASDPRSTIIPLVQFQDVPLRAAIANLARQVDLKYELDPKVDFQDPDLPEPVISARWEDVTAPQVLFTLLHKYNLQWIDHPETGIGRVTTNPSVSPRVHVDFAVREQIRELIQAAIGGGTNNFEGPIANGCQGFALVTKSLSPVKPTRLIVRARKTPNLKEVAEFFPVSTWVSTAQTVALRVESVGGGFRVVLSPPPYTAAEYLAWSDQFVADFDAIREAVKRPYARMDGDYQQPQAVPIPNHVTLRSVTQTLAQRVQCYLLFEQSGKALRELSLIHDLCRSLEGKPTGRPMNLVAVMSEAAVTGLYASTIADGLRWRAWREPQLVAIQAQLEQINLPPLLAAGFRSERAGIIRTLESVLASKSSRNSATNLSQHLPPHAKLRFGIPRGWFHQNYINLALSYQDLIDSLDLTNNVVLCGKANRFRAEIERKYTGFRPYTFLAAIATPNFTKAIQTLALNQTEANEALIACALERYRLAQGQYPESLDALTPQFIEKLPHDILNGQPLKYRRKGEGQFLLYSVGWNETDDGGIAGLGEAGALAMAKGDWVWPPASK